MTSQTIASVIDRIKIVDLNHPPHWRKYGKGTASLEVSRDGLQLTLDTSQLIDSGKEGKRTIIELHPESGRALYKWMKEIFAP